MPKKGQIEEIISQAIFTNETSLYSILYRDLDSSIEISLEEWLVLSKADNIPIHRIISIKKLNDVIFERTPR